MLDAWVRTASMSAANFTPPALPRPPGMHLSLHHHRRSQPLRGGHRVVHGGNRLAGRHRHVIRREKLFSLVFE